MLQLRRIEEADVIKIKDWPVYSGDMAQMDYALREKGWLDECRSKPDTFVYAVEKEGELIGFSILIGACGRAEFRIALRADKTGQGLGEAITMLTLLTGFCDHGFSEIHLIVRKNNNRGIRLYRRIGFKDRGECRKEINGVLVDFWVMDMVREDFLRLQREKGELCHAER